MSVGHKGYESRWKKWQGRYCPRGINIARGGTCGGLDVPQGVRQALGPRSLSHKEREETQRMSR